MARFALRTLRLRPGEEHREAVSLTIEPFDLGGEEYVADPAEIPAELVVQRATSGDLFRLGFVTGVAGPCMRCLAPASVTVEVDAREYNAVDDGADDELSSDYVAAGELDLGTWARDQVALALPDQILCRPDCTGLCPVCGKDLNFEPHAHEEIAVDSRWAALEALRSDPERG